MSSESKTFDFIQLEHLPDKPRKTGIIEFRGPYYTPVTYGYLNDLLDDWGEYVDGFKFAGGSMRLLDRDKTRKMIQLCHKYNVYVSTGGFVERVIVQGPEAVDRYLDECKSLEFDMVEVSSGLASIKLEDKVAIVKQVQKLGMKAKPEVSMMIGAGAGTHIVGYKTKMRTFRTSPRKQQPTSTPAQTSSCSNQRASRKTFLRANGGKMWSRNSSTSSATTLGCSKPQTRQSSNGT